LCSWWYRSAWAWPWPAGRSTRICGPEGAPGSSVTEGRSRRGRRKNRVAAAAGLTIMAAMHDSTFLDSRDFARIARAIRYIDANFRTQPRLAAIAAQARLSEFHFNRLFRRWAGITPKQYLGFVTARAARAALASTPSVLGLVRGRAVRPLPPARSHRHARRRDPRRTQGRRLRPAARLRLQRYPVRTGAAGEHGARRVAPELRRAGGRARRPRGAHGTVAAGAAAAR